VDPLTHALASYILNRAAFPRVTRLATLAIVLAGTVADLDSFSSFFGPSAFLTFYRAGFHSLFAAVLFALLVTIPFLLRKTPSIEKPVSPYPVFIAALLAAALHLLLDACQSVGVELFWPFSARRFALDWLPRLDLWILTLLLAGIFLPMLSGLVTEEIGAKSKGPRGRTGALLALAALLLYLLARFTLHSNALAAMESRIYHGESPKRVAAFAESGSPFRWHGIIETESALHDVEVDVGPAARFDPDAAVTSYKPEASPALDAARNSPVARRFLQVARFPKASVEKTPEGFHIILHDFPYTRGVTSGWPIDALIDTDPSTKILSEEFAWDPASRQLWWK
jgi:inner membrane protein